MTYIHENGYGFLVLRKLKDDMYEILLKPGFAVLRKESQILPLELKDSDKEEIVVVRF